MIKILIENAIYENRMRIYRNGASFFLKKYGRNIAERMSYNFLFFGNFEEILDLSIFIKIIAVEIKYTAAIRNQKHSGAPFALSMN
ncbi:MAG: hypothetical protein DHS20C03_16820 [Minwuia thermotolerans]|nr:MAG: hypothetical protein DHS20C03_16820 [Minwuia thermotolerans]